MSSANKDTSSDDDLDRKISEYVQIGLPVVIVSLVILAGVFVDAPTALLVAAAGALIAVIAVFWSSLRTLLGETPLTGADVYVLSAPSHMEEEQKRAVLRALKDIEFERSVGKISDEDYQQLKAKYRDEAKRLIQSIDERSAEGRKRAEVLLQKKLRQVGLVEGGSTKPVDDEADETNATTAPDEANIVDTVLAESAVAAVSMVLATKPPTKKKKKAKKKPVFEVEEPVVTDACPKCKTVNDKDAVFCKKCGTRVGKPEEISDEAKPETKSETDEEADAS
ncbi:MAG TPA: zinc ribbon domain-containing protein [Polyangium sp.]|nr:zinc ribbon domain-containing protein [Polyangium sp.]